MVNDKEKLRVQYCFLSKIGESPLRKKKLRCYLFDISLMGAGLITDEALERGRIIFLRINRRALDIKKDMSVVGKVVRANPYSNKYLTGVEFIKITNKDKSDIEKFVSSYIYKRKHRFYFQ